MRWTLVPWLSNADFIEGRRERFCVYRGASLFSAWTVDQPFGEEDGCMILRAERGNGNDGGTIALALTDHLDICDGPPLPANVQTNPRKDVDDEDMA